jgi:hypothetical protein
MFIVEYFNGSNWSRLTASGSEAGAIQAADRYSSRYDAVRVTHGGMVVYCA